MAKKNLLVTILILGTVILGILYLTGNLGGKGLVFGEPDSCVITPTDARCICGIDELKVYKGTISEKWECVSLPEVAESVELPIETWEEAQRFAELQIGNDFSCSGEFFYQGGLSGSISQDANGGYGGIMYGSDKNILGHSVNLECLKILELDEQGVIKSGTTVWRVQFDPNTGFVQLLNCNSNILENCPEPIGFQLEGITLPPICSDNRCTLGETEESCFEDCAGSDLKCGNGICDESSAINVCFTDCYIHYLPEVYLEPDSFNKRCELQAYIYGFEGTLQELDSNLKYACENYRNFRGSGEIISVEYSSDLTDLNKVEFSCVSFRRTDQSSFSQDLFSQTVNWNEKIAPPATMCTSMLADFPLP